MQYKKIIIRSLPFLLGLIGFILGEILRLPWLTIAGFITLALSVIGMFYLLVIPLLFRNVAFHYTARPEEVQKHYEATARRGAIGIPLSILGIFLFVGGWLNLRDVKSDAIFFMILGAVTFIAGIIHYARRKQIAQKIAEYDQKRFHLWAKIGVATTVAVYAILKLIEWFGQ